MDLVKFLYNAGCLIAGTVRLHTPPRSTGKSSCRVVMELLLQHADDVLMPTPLKVHQM